MDSKKRVVKLVKTLKRDFGEWPADAVNIQYFHKETKENLTAYVDGKDPDTLVKLETSRLHTWHLTHYESIALNRSEFSANELALATRYACWEVLFSEPLARQNRGGGLLKDDAAFYLALQIICGWQASTVAVGDALVEGLDTDLLDLRINDRHESGVLFPHFWFLMHLYCAARGMKPIDTALYAYPESLAPYDTVLADWKTTDLSKVHQWVVDMAEHHVQMTDDSDPDGKTEFDFDRAKLFPYEILAFLRLREWSGLANPAEFAHPLMQQPLAYLPPDVPLVLPDTPLLNQVIARYRQEFPDLRVL
jgi:hypothetical protein